MEDKKYICPVLEILPNGDAVVELNSEIIKKLNWQVGDELDYQTKDGKIYIINLTRKRDE